ncbi:velvet factor-domain-containing protein [Phakopsora pachyrhizi]|nr:velvet factor-domain-containing protein [Phakopsora pachyrhizi]
MMLSNESYTMLGAVGERQPKAKDLDSYSSTASHQPKACPNQNHRPSNSPSTSVDSGSHSPASCSGSDVAYKFAAENQKTHVAREQIDYKLRMIQQPKRSRMVGSGEKADRRPIDPPPIAGFQAVCSSQGDGETDLTLLRSPAFICYATLCESAPPHKELFTIPHSKKPFVVGTRVSSIFQLRESDPPACNGHYFVFPDLGVRVEGQYRLKLSVYEIEDTKVHFCASIVTDQFEVFSAKKFPGMNESTPLSKTFAKQGIRLRVRTKISGPSDKQLSSQLVERFDREDKHLTQASPHRKKRKKQPLPQDLPSEPTCLQNSYLPNKNAKIPGQILPSLDDMLNGVPVFEESHLNPSVADKIASSLPLDRAD